MDEKLKQLLGKYESSDFCGCYDGDTDNRFPETREELAQKLLVLFNEENSELVNALKIAKTDILHFKETGKMLLYPTLEAIDKVLPKEIA